jgi:DNA-directed RNA polymerase I subunit RPA1
MDLALPLYNPLLLRFTTLLLNLTCHKCFRLKVSQPMADRYLELLRKLSGRDGGEYEKNQSDDLQEEEEEGKGKGKKKKKNKNKNKNKKYSGDAQTYSSTPLSYGNEAALQSLLETFFHEASKSKCERCSQVSPKYILEGMNRILQVTGDSVTAHAFQKTPSGLKGKEQQQNGTGATRMESSDTEEEEEEDDDSVDRKKKLYESENKDLDSEDSDSEEDLQAKKIKRSNKKKSDEAMASAPAPKKKKEVETKHKYVSPREVQIILDKVLMMEGDFFSLMCEYAQKTNRGAAPKCFTKDDGWQSAFGELNQLKTSNPKTFLFLSVLPIVPPRFRPMSKLGDSMFDHPQNVIYSNILNANTSLSKLVEHKRDAESASEGGMTRQEEKEMISQQLARLWRDLQTQVNTLLDANAAGKGGGVGIGLQQLIEKKEGIFRMNMMGKRVNYAARSVISPDPYIGVGEIGIPPYFAQRLSFPEHTNAHNAQQLSKRVMNGAQTYPGALLIEDAKNGSKIQLGPLARNRREKLAQLINIGSVQDEAPQYSSPVKREKKTENRTTEGAANGVISSGQSHSGRISVIPKKIVHRHAQTGDVVLVNRQPTLHKPSILAHNMRVLKGERTIRMHYANCSGYNADFDGDEINVHLPQDQMSRAEAYTIMHSTENFVVSTDGKPIKGLIQDHVISSVYLTMQNTFLSRKRYELLVYEACCILPNLNPKLNMMGSDDGEGVASMVSKKNLKLLPPTIIKPQALWTGKQVISSVLINVLGDKKFTFTGNYKAKVTKNYWCKGSLESQMYVKECELLHGVLDKAQYGKFGLVHSVQELYGADTMAYLMGSFSRLFTKFLQFRGFTCSIDDLSLNQESESKREEALSTQKEEVKSASSDLLGLDSSLSVDDLEGHLRQELLGYNKEAFGAKFDAVCTGALNTISSTAVNSCLPVGSTKQFPKNNFNMMTCSGAKGSSVNHSQISVLLGQQTLEGRRVPRMESGKTLPCFLAYTVEPRSCGFIADRFLTGLQPQEYYFHCMAGREGLVDTTVKTARSGYLQRCLVKSLESLSVKYDGTVRDARGGFDRKMLPGEMAKQQTNKQKDHHHGSIVQFKYGEDGVDPAKESYLYKFDFLVQNCMPLAQKLKQTLNFDDGTKVGDDATARSSAATTSSRFNTAWGEYADSSGSSNNTQPSKKQKKRHKSSANKGSGTNERVLKGLLNAKHSNSLSSAGDAVGVIAAQSIGEPSTQMTLNTFHHAGRGEANVTLGIPRLRELLMTATKEIRTPYIKVPFSDAMNEEQSLRLASRLRKISLLEILKTIQVTEKPYVWDDYTKLVMQSFTVKFSFHAINSYMKEAGISLEKSMITRCINSDFTQKMKARLTKLTRKGATFTLARKSGVKDDAFMESDAADLAEALEEDVLDVQDDAAGGADGDKASGVKVKGMSSEDIGKVGLDDPFDVSVLIQHESLRKLPLLELCEQVCMSCYVNMTAGVENADKITMQVSPKVEDYTLGEPAEVDKPRLLVQGKGGNLLECLLENSHKIDLTCLESNDIHMMQNTFGIEAARRVLKNEVIKVFGAYGIKVDPRHLSLVSDFMTHSGVFKGCNRSGTFPQFGSPLLQMSFETATQFLRKSVLFNTQDEMRSPSSNIACGQLVTTCGTGVCDLLYKTT